jgi:hypothetical protein
MEPSFRSIREQLLVLDETVIDSHGGNANLVILSLGMRKCRLKIWVMINAYSAWTHEYGPVTTRILTKDNTQVTSTVTMANGAFLYAKLAPPQAV